MEVVRVFNNNVLLARDDHRGEVVVTGRGIGFGVRPGQRLEPSDIAKVFVPEPGRDVDLLGTLVAAIAPEHLRLADQALEVARADLGIVTTSATVVALADHLGFALHRARSDTAVAFPLQAEVEHLYPQELAAARRVVQYVDEHTGVPLPDGEAVAIAMHLVNAGFTTGDLSPTYRMTGLLGQLFDVLDLSCGRHLDRTSVNAARFITHVRYFFVRAETGRQLVDNIPSLGPAIRRAHPDAHGAATRLQAVLELRLGQPLREEEVTYLALHIARLLADERSDV